MNENRKDMKDNMRNERRIKNAGDDKLVRKESAKGLKERKK